MTDERNKDQKMKKLMEKIILLIQSKNPQSEAYAGGILNYIGTKFMTVKNKKKHKRYKIFK